jgi:prevent-host-death family protein
MRSVAVSIFKAQCLSLLENVARTGRPLLITKRGKPLARVTPGEHSRASSPQATLRGTVETLGDLLAPVIPMAVWNAPRGVLLTQDESSATHKPLRTRRRPRR